MGALALDRVAEAVESVKADCELFDQHFRQGHLYQSELALRTARDRLTRSIATIRRRGH